MRNILFLFLVFCSCNAPTSSETENFIPGTYIRQSETEFGKIYDTLIISSQNANAHQYNIEKEWRYDRVLDGNPDPEYKKEKTSGIYDSKTKLLQDMHSGNYYSFDLGKGVLFVGTNQYKKIK